MFAITLIAFIFWDYFGYYIVFGTYLILKTVGLPMPIIQLILRVLPLILTLEIFVKGILLQFAVRPLKFVSTQPESWRNVSQEKLARYTSELEQLGFVKLIDFTGSGMQGMARLFAHPQKFYFAEVGQVSNVPMFCSIFCYLDEQWCLGVTNNSPSPMTSAVWYAFLRQPRSLVKPFENASPNLLLQLLPGFQEQVAKDLNLKQIQDIQIETHFEKERINRIKQRRSLLRKSMTWALLEMLWFSVNPKSEWLGDYAKFNLKR